MYIWKICKKKKMRRREVLYFYFHFKLISSILISVIYVHILISCFTVNIIWILHVYSTWFLLKSIFKTYLYILWSKKYHVYTVVDIMKLVYCTLNCLNVWYIWFGTRNCIEYYSSIRQYYLVVFNSIETHRFYHNQSTE